jgi:hypothetical protein
MAWWMLASVSHIQAVDLRHSRVALKFDQLASTIQGP